MKIKTKKELNLPQLIEWAWDNRATENTYKSESITVTFSISGNPRIESEHTFLPKNETFTVEIEEEITEDTVIEKLYHTTIPSRIVESGCSTIKSTLEHSTVEPIAFYILNDDLTMTLIWRNGKLVE